MFPCREILLSAQIFFLLQIESIPFYSDFEWWQTLKAETLYICEKSFNGFYLESNLSSLLAISGS